MKEGDEMLRMLTALFGLSTLLWCIITDSGLCIQTENTTMWYRCLPFLFVFQSNPLFQDAAAAALFTACKIEDTLKKSRDIVCAAYNLKLSPSEHLAPDDPVCHTHPRNPW